jgi:mono/diheme cytochrome c family protein
VFASPLAAPAAEVTYDDIAPLLAVRCVLCHKGPAAPLGLRLDSLEGLLAGSRNGPVAVAGDPAGSELLRRLTGASLPRMPMTGPPYLSDEEIALFEQWIEQGMPAGDAGAAAVPAPAQPPVPPREKAPVNWADVAVLFATRCAKCHTGQGLMGPAPEGYLLTSYEAALSAADRARIVPGNVDASELVRRVRGEARPRMPFDGPPYLSAEEIALIERWIAEGARDATGVPAKVPVGRRIRLHGTLDAAGRLDGLPLTLTSRTRRDDDTGAGEYVRVRGTIAEDGSIVVERIQDR